MRKLQFTTLITCPAYRDRRPDDRIEVSGYCARSSTELTYPRLDVLTDILNARPPERDSLFSTTAEPAWSLALPALPDAVFHYLSRGRPRSAFQGGKEVRMDEAISSSSLAASRMFFGSDHKTKPFPLHDLDRPPATSISFVTGVGDTVLDDDLRYFSLSRPSEAACSICFHPCFS